MKGAAHTLSTVRDRVWLPAGSTPMLWEMLDTSHLVWRDRGNS